MAGTHNTDNLRRWTVDVPHMALDCEPLRHAMFALSILYIFSCSKGKDNSQSSENLETWRARYLEAAFAQHRQALDHLDASSADRTSYTSMLLMLDALACLQERPLEPYEPPHLWLQMSQGTKSVAGTTVALAQGDPRSKLYSHHNSAFNVWDPMALSSDANKRRFPYLMHGFAETDDAGDWEIYMEAVCFVGSADIAREAGEHPNLLARRVLIFPCFVEPRFVQLVSLQKPRALAILAHLFGIAMRANDCWFLGKTPAREIAAIDKCLGHEWRELLVWPMQLIRQEPSGA